MLVRIFWPMSTRNFGQMLVMIFWPTIAKVLRPIWNQPWLTSSSNQFISSPTSHGLEQMKVPLIDHENKVWHVDIMQQILSNEDIQQIHSIPISNNNG